MKNLQNLILFVSLALLLYCQSQQVEDKNKSQTKKISVYIDSVKVIKARREVSIPIKGYLNPWKVVNLSLQDSTRIISLVVEQGAIVRKGDQLASLWKIKRYGENTPIDLIAPISGIVAKSNYSINALVPKSKTIIRLENRKYFTMSVKLEEWQKRIIRKGTIVQFQLSTGIQKGWVEAIEKDYVLLKMKNTQQMLKEVFAYGTLDCGEISGYFIKSKYFASKNPVEIKLNENIELDVFASGQSDSLTLIYPPLPGQNYIRIFQKTLDL